MSSRTPARPGSPAVGRRPAAPANPGSAAPMGPRLGPGPARSWASAAATDRLAVCQARLRRPYADRASSIVQSIDAMTEGLSAAATFVRLAVSSAAMCDCTGPSRALTCSVCARATGLSLGPPGSPAPETERIPQRRQGSRRSRSGRRTTEERCLRSTAGWCSACPSARPLQNGPAISAIAVNAKPLSDTVITEGDDISAMLTGECSQSVIATRAIDAAAAPAMIRIGIGRRMSPDR